VIGDATSAAPEADVTWVRVHVPVEVTYDTLRAGSSTRRFEPGSARSLLKAYLGLVREMRDQRRARTIELRSADIDALAAHLGIPGSEVVEQLAALMGATRDQRATMIGLFGAGALVIGLAGSGAVSRAESPTSVPTIRVAPISIDAGSPTPSTAPISVASAPPATSPSTSPVTTIAAPAPTSTAPPAVEAPVPTSAAPPADTTVPPTIDDRPSSGGSDSSPATQAPEPTPAPTTTEAIVTDIGDPPLPPVTTEAPITDIGDPPLPPATTEPVVTDIGDPPLPPTTVDPTVAG
jgi:hypothetical protein